MKAPGDYENIRFSIESSERQNEKRCEVDNYQFAFGWRYLGFLPTPSNLDAAGTYPAGTRLVLCFLLDGRLFPWRLIPKLL